MHPLLTAAGTSIRSPLLGQLTPLAHLTRLHMGGCEVTDADITQHIAAFCALQDLDLWGSAAGDASVRAACACLTRLSKLSLAWSHVSCAWLPSLTWLDLSHCQLRGPYSDADFVAATEMQQLRVLVLVQAQVCAMGCELLEVVLRCGWRQGRVCVNVGKRHLHITNMHGACC